MALEATQRLDELTVAQLRQMARERGIKKYSKMKKAELIEALERGGHGGADRGRERPHGRYPIHLRS